MLNVTPGFLVDERNDGYERGANMEDDEYNLESDYETADEESEEQSHKSCARIDIHSNQTVNIFTNTGNQLLTVMTHRSEK